MTGPNQRRTAFVFPGQGSQTIGMGRLFAEQFDEAREVFREADEALGFAISQLCFEGPEEELQLTTNTQPALVATSVAIFRCLGSLVDSAVVVAGHSLGEYSALVAAGALPLTDALRLVRRRGELMQQAVPLGEGAMAAILGLSCEQVSQIADQAAEAEICAVANYNAPTQTVIAGHRQAVDRAIELAKAQGARRAVGLAVSAPFHCALMRPAREGMEPLLADASFADVRTPVMTNVDATAVRRGDQLRQALGRQIDHPVRWVESIERAVRDFGVDRVIEVGPGKVLTGLVKRIVPGVETATMAVPADLEKLAAALASS